MCFKPKLEQLLIIWLLLLCRAHQSYAGNSKSYLWFQNVEDGFPFLYKLPLPIVQEPAPERQIREQYGEWNQIYLNRDSKYWQANLINKTTTRHIIDTQGIHRLRIRILEPGIVLQKIIVDTGGLKPGYLGLPQSRLSFK